MLFVVVHCTMYQIFQNNKEKHEGNVFLRKSLIIKLHLSIKISDNNCLMFAKN